MVDNGNGTVTDEATGLMWQQVGSSGTWEKALAYCEGLSLGGYTDWRLPTIKELQSLVDYSRYSPAINTKYFSDAQSAFYWSSTTAALNTGYAWGIDFLYGHDGVYNKSFSYHVIAVRTIYGAVQIKKSN